MSILGSVLLSFVPSWASGVVFPLLPACWPIFEMCKRSWSKPMSRQFQGRYYFVHHAGVSGRLSRGRAHPGLCPAHIAHCTYQCPVPHYPPPCPLSYTHAMCALVLGSDTDDRSHSGLLSRIYRAHEDCPWDGTKVSVNQDRLHEVKQQFHDAGRLSGLRPLNLHRYPDLLLEVTHHHGSCVSSSVMSGYFPNSQHSQEACDRKHTCATLCT